ncbi:MAG: ornithine cyclodeaminase family protein [Rhodothermales bacterium]|nr:ornithine cyclodeaminase family protein [Rhodothermales bacterium]
MIRSISDALVTLTPDRAELPLRSGFHYHEPVTGLIEWMPVMVNGSRATIKVVGYHPENPRRYELPTILGTVSSYDTRTGHLVGLADGTFLTALRTGAASGVATAAMATADTKTLGIIGCGAQAVAQLHAVSRVRKIARVLTYDLDPATTASFPARIEVLGLDDLTVEVADCERVVRESDVLCTATSVDVGGGPVFPDTETKPWLHINAAGSDFEGKFEIPKAMLKRAYVCPDILLQAISQGECQQLTKDDIGVELPVLIGDRELCESLMPKLTVFDSTGSALEDHVALELMLGYGREFGLGAEIEIESFSHDAKNPYEFVFEDRGVAAVENLGRP